MVWRSISSELNPGLRNIVQRMRRGTCDTDLQNRTEYQKGGRLCVRLGQYDNRFRRIRLQIKAGVEKSMGKRHYRFG